MNPVCRQLNGLILANAADKQGLINIWDNALLAMHFGLSLHRLANLGASAIGTYQPVIMGGEDFSVFRLKRHRLTISINANASPV